MAEPPSVALPLLVAGLTLLFLGLAAWVWRKLPLAGTFSERQAAALLAVGFGVTVAAGGIQAGSSTQVIAPTTTTSTTSTTTTTTTTEPPTTTTAEVPPSTTTIPEPPPPTGRLTVTFLDVGQGDSALYEGPCGELGIVDVNRGAASTVLRALDEAGTRKVRWISTSHYDADHIGGVVDLGTASGVTIGRVFDRGGDRNIKDTQTYRRYYDWVLPRRSPVDIGQQFVLCSGPQTVTFRVVSAGTDGTAAQEKSVSEENDRGVCLKVTFRKFDLATCGDVNGTDEGSRSDVETAVAPAYGDVEAAKVNHHGSRFSSNATYVHSLRAQVAVIPVGRNSFGHPDGGVVARWDRFGDVLQTLVHGHVTLMADGISDFALSTASGVQESYALD